jgi:hypothetical protein
MGGQWAGIDIKFIISRPEAVTTRRVPRFSYSEASVGKSYLGKRTVGIVVGV